MTRIATTAVLVMPGLVIAATGSWGALALAIAGPRDDTVR